MEKKAHFFIINCFDNVAGKAYDTFDKYFVAVLGWNQADHIAAPHRTLQWVREVDIVQLQYPVFFLSIQMRVYQRLHASNYLYV